MLDCLKHLDATTFSKIEIEMEEREARRRAREFASAPSAPPPPPEPVTKVTEAREWALAVVEGLREVANKLAALAASRPPPPRR
jgi:hypothetical protein